MNSKKWEQSKHQSTVKESELINTNFFTGFNWLNVPVIGTLL